MFLSRLDTKSKQKKIRTRWKKYNPPRKYSQEDVPESSQCRSIKRKYRNNHMNRQMMKTKIESSLTKFRKHKETDLDVKLEKET